MSSMNTLLKKICSISYSSNKTLLLWSKFMQMELWKVKNRDLPFLLPCVEGLNLSGTSATEEFSTVNPRTPPCYMEVHSSKKSPHHNIMTCIFS